MRHRIPSFAGCHEQSIPPQAPTTSIHEATKPQLTRIAAPEFFVSNQDHRFATVIVPRATSDEEISNLIWLLRDTTHARNLNSLGISETFAETRDPMFTVHIYRGASRHVRKLPASLRRSLTWDRGLEMAKHKSFTVATHMQVFFCDPQSPWQRGTNENTNGLLRQYFPKKTDLSGYSQSDLDKVALRLNQRPRKTLGFETPASKLQASVASIH